MTRALLDWVVDILLIGWAVLMIAVAAVAVWCLIEITRHRSHGREPRGRLRSRWRMDRRDPGDARRRI